MSVFSHIMANVGSSIAAMQGEEITYLAKDDSGDTTATETIALAVVVPLGSEGYTAEDGRFWSSAIQVLIQTTDLTIRSAHNEMEHDVITWDGQNWTIIAVKQPTGAWEVVAVQHERTAATGHGPARQTDRRVRTTGEDYG